MNTKVLKRRFPGYSKLLYLYPVSYRKQYGDQMMQTLADMLDNSVSKWEHLAIWFKVVADLPFSIGKQQLIYTGEIMNHEMPNYVKRSSFVGLALLLPFVCALIANGLDRAINNHDLYHSWLWRMPALAMWALWLPVAALVLMTIGLIVFMRQPTSTEHTNWVHRLLDVRHNWPILAVGFIALSIVALVFFHDSVHCVSGNPIRELHNPSQTWQCILQR